MSALSREMEESFFASQRSAAVPFVINDSMSIVSGPQEGRAGAVISIVAVEPEVELLVELKDGLEARLLAKQIRLLEDAG